MGKWTPGPWHANPCYEGWWIHNGQSGSDEFAICVTFSGNPNSEADARLIAAAPELVEALKLWARWNDMTEAELAIALEATTAALAKANGGGNG